ncbi:MAG: T9SS type A sorting domain-containing protein, partial [Bacteroidia bacterium]
MTPGILGPDLFACSSSPATLSFNWPSTNLLWSTSATTSSIQVSAAGQYILTASGACASGSDTVNITAVAPVVDSVTAVSCDSFVSPGGNIYSISGVYNDTLVSAVTGCDSIITTSLTINATTSSSVSPAVCGGSYTAPSGASYSATGMYMDTIPNAAGCDSVITINLTVNQPSADSIAPVVCGSYTSPSGMSYASSGMYMDTIPNAAGCDSVITINLTVNQPSTATVTASTCTGTYTAPSGAVYTTSGMYMDTIPNASGCDSLITLNLTIGATTYSSIGAVVCGSYLSPAGNQYTSSGVYTDTIPNASGCDSLITINLVVNPIPTVTFGINTSTVCFDDGGIILIASPAGGTFSGPGVSGNTFLPATAGNGFHSITYTYTDQNGCSNSAPATITVDPCVGVSELASASAFSVFPNPSNETFNVVTSADADVLLVRLFDLQGRAVYTAQLNNVVAGTPVAVNAGELSAGIYSMQLSNGAAATSVRVVITK